MMRPLVSLLLLTAPVLHAEETRKPNIILIAADDLNHWIGDTGRDPQTKKPNTSNADDIPQS